ncbi:MAG: hypothetical protein AAF998_26510 [Bacteroidota bacterium]
MKNYVVAVAAAVILLCLSVQESQAEPYRYGGWKRTSVGVRFGWNGGPNGLTIRRTFAPGQAFEVVAGYNPKYGGGEDLPFLRGGNSFLGISYAPHLLMSNGNVGVALVGNVGVRANYHHYRYFNRPQWGPKITPEVIAGGGLQVEFSEKVELFADLHLKYFSSPYNAYTAGMESGAGIRFTLN